MSADTHDAPTGSTLHRQAPLQCMLYAGAVYTSLSKCRGVHGDKPTSISVKNRPRMRTSKQKHEADMHVGAAFMLFRCSGAPAAQASPLRDRQTDSHARSHKAGHIS